MSSTDEVSQQAEFADSVFSNLFETFVKPELRARIAAGTLPDPFPLEQLKLIQIVFYPDGRKPAVRINTEVDAIVEVRPKPNIAIEAGDPVFVEQIESIGRIALTKDETDYGHATFVRMPDRWSGSFDFRYYKGTAANHLTVAEQFLQAAQGSRDAQHWVAFADNLFSAAELAAKASLLCLDFDRTFLKSKRHSTIKVRFNRQRHIGNVDAAHATALNRLWELRQDGRYLAATISFEESDADQLLQDVRSLIDAARRWAVPFSE